MSVTDGYEEFVAIVETGSMTAAAESLGIPRPTLSRRLDRLESRLGIRLLHRSTRRLKTTPEGELFYAKARRVVLAAHEAEAEIRRLDGIPRGLLRVSVPMGVPDDLFGGWFAEFLALYPEVQLEMVASSAHEDLIGSGFDLALRAGEMEDQSLIIRKVADNLKIAVASPQYLEKYGTPQSPEDLRHHRCLVGFRAGIAPETRWPLLDGGWVSITGPLITNVLGLRLVGALRHLGIAMVIDRMALPHIEKGELVPVLPEILGTWDPIVLTYPDKTFMAPKVRVFADFFWEKLRSTWTRSELKAKGPRPSKIDAVFNRGGEGEAH